MSGQLEYPKHSDQPDHPEDCEGHRLILAILVRHHWRFGGDFLLLFRHNGSEGNEVGDDGDQVYHVHDVSAELHFTRAGEESH